MVVCTFDCTAFFAKALLCQNVNHFDIPSSIPTIPTTDPILDACLCQQSMISAMHTCAVCRGQENATLGDVTQLYVDGCNKEFAGRNLVVPSAAYRQKSNTKLQVGLSLISLAVLTCASVLGA
ncbi:hypothetical protein BGZ83_003340 [Gryganskiella cystojenkinii]|nr:hypothetical protein BGZ83_003340 [Gryganskiella cystojenkinii]